MKDFILVNKMTFDSLLKQLKYLPILVVNLLAYTIIYTLATLLLARIQFVGGLLLYLLKGAMVSHFVYCLHSLIIYNKVSFTDYFLNAKTYLSQTISVFFIYYLLDTIIKLVFINGIAWPFDVLIRLIVFLIFSASLEAIYIGNYFQYDSVMESIRIVKENIVNWTLTLGAIFILLALIGGIDLDLFTDNNWFIFNIIPSMKAINIILLAFFYLYKGNLYKTLYNSSKRKREYMGRF